MRSGLYWSRANRRGHWTSMLAVIVVCAILGAVALGAVAGARRTESAYGRYLTSVDASDVAVNIPLPGVSAIPLVGAGPGIRSASAWLGLNANPVLHGRVDYSFLS